jgi:hypothetical protein
MEGRGWPVRIVTTRGAGAEELLMAVLTVLDGELERCGEAELVAWVTALGPLSANARLCGALDAADPGWRGRMRVLEQSRPWRPVRPAGARAAHHA